MLHSSHCSQPQSAKADFLITGLLEAQQQQQQQQPMVKVVGAGFRIAVSDM